jgi:N-acylneuraminate cytidylyltransferase
MFQPNLFNTRSQDLEEAWHDAGQFYWGTPESWLEHKPFFSSNSVPVILPSYRVQDIDNVEDWTRAELMFEIIKRVDQL